eukprot:COSAG05_NODE_2211_length_3385_cov_160.566590_4_plen_101_part_00
MRNKTLVAHHRALMPRAAHPAGVYRTHYHYCHSILPDMGGPSPRAPGSPARSFRRWSAAGERAPPAYSLAGWLARLAGAAVAVYVWLAGLLVGWLAGWLG